MSGLDPVGRKEVVDILQACKLQGLTLLFSSHLLHDVERLADTYCLLHQGRLELLQTADQFVRQSRYVIACIDKHGNRQHRAVADADLWQQLELLRNSGYYIVSVNPELDLENYFHKVVGSKI